MERYWRSPFSKAHELLSPKLEVPLLVFCTWTNTRTAVACFLLTWRYSRLALNSSLTAKCQRQVAEKGPVLCIPDTTERCAQQCIVLIRLSPTDGRVCWWSWQQNALIIPCVSLCPALSSFYISGFKPRMYLPPQYRPKTNLRNIFK